MEMSGRSYACGLPNGPPMLASGLGAGFISETPVKRSDSLSYKESTVGKDRRQMQKKAVEHALDANSWSQQLKEKGLSQFSLYYLDLVVPLL